VLTVTKGLAYHIEVSGNNNNIEQNSKHLQTDASVWTLVKTNQAKPNQLRWAFYYILIIIYCLLIIILIVLPKTAQ
jgi:hypothetical protein